VIAYSSSKCWKDGARRKVGSDCRFALLTGPELVDNPNLLLNEQETPLATWDDFVYLMYYTDAECTNFGAMKGLVADAPFTVPVLVNDDIATLATCEASLACLLNPTGGTCRSLSHYNATSMLTLTYSVSEDGRQQLCNIGTGKCRDSNSNSTMLLQASSYVGLVHQS